LESEVGELLDSILAGTAALVARQRISPASSEEFFILGGGIAHITTDLATLTKAMRDQVNGNGENRTLRGAVSAAPTRSADLHDRLEVLRTELKKANTAARAYQFAAGHYGGTTDLTQV